ncbi:MAG: methyl-accepting chemotaxis protein [Roseburia sp.]|nr:methyl-accepting chemotaxis protein [Ruminococcus sp.]MCM1155265.1 methyl-accepting chemotaxis protein [Roseburia sp.]MCM1241235.1 methyl-accepting chemotaxis protein [Roseburia sp.]
MSTQEKNQTKKSSLFQSIKGRISLLLIACIVGVVVVLLFLILPNVKNSMKNLTQNYLYDITVSAGERINLAAAESDMETILNAESLKQLVGSIGLEGVDSSYAYVVAADGTMLYHPTESKIGQPVENAVVSGVVKDIQSGSKNIEPKVVDYEFKGVIKYAAYYVNADNDFILVISADEDEVMQPITRIMQISIVAAVLIIIICSVIGYILAGSMISPVIKITSVINKLADMDFTENDIQMQLNKRKDETGEMSRSISTLHDQLIAVVTGLKYQSESLFSAADSLSTNVSETAATIEHVEKAVSEIADGAGVQATETQRATDNVILMGNMVKDTTGEVENLLVNATGMKTSSDEASSTLVQLEQINRQAKEAIDTIYEQTNTTNESAMKIREATTLITSIAEETNLLSLNASIEAARAGDQGRGFAVVASQIQKLAEQSNESASQIEAITDSLIADSEKAVAIMGEVKDIMAKQNEHVTKTDAIFTQVKNGIDSSIDGVTRIAEKTRHMDEARVNVVDIVQSLTAIAQENAASTEETSASVTEVSSIVSNIAGNTEQMKNVADELENNMKVFKL